MVGSEDVEQVADRVVAGDVVSAAQGVAVGAAGSVAHAALEVATRGGLDEEEGESAAGGVGKDEVPVAAPAEVRQGAGGLTECREKKLQDISDTS